MNKETYTTSEMAEILGVSTRTIQRHIAKLRDKLSPKDNKYDNEVFKILSTVLNNTKQHQETTGNDNYDHIEYFTNEEYQEFHKRLVEYPLLLDKIKLLLDELDFHKKQIGIHQDQQTKLIESIKERNFIEAKEKDLD